MPAPTTLVILTDDDGDEFPVRLPGVYHTLANADIVSAFKIAAEYVKQGYYTPRGELKFGRVEYLNEVRP